MLRSGERIVVAMYIGMPMIDISPHTCTVIQHCSARSCFLSLLKETVTTSQ